MNYALDSCCVFNPVAHVGLFLHLHLASLLPGLELCPSPKLPMLLPYTLLQCRHHVYRLRRHFWAPNVWSGLLLHQGCINPWLEKVGTKEASLGVFSNVAKIFSPNLCIFCIKLAKVGQSKNILAINFMIK